MKQKINIFPCLACLFVVFLVILSFSVVFSPPHQRSPYPCYYCVGDQSSLLTATKSSLSITFDNIIISNPLGYNQDTAI